VNEGCDAQFSVRYVGGAPRPTATWFLDEQEITAAHESFQALALEDTVSLSIRQAKASHAASYSVRLSNEAGSVTSNKALLAVNCNHFVHTAQIFCSLAHGGLLIL
jgi:homoserine dehydrogenase